jgi:hypothetical protein
VTLTVYAGTWLGVSEGPLTKPSSLFGSEKKRKSQKLENCALSFKYKEAQVG